MFADCRTDDELHHPAAEVLRMLRDAGCDMTNECNLQMGLVAYNAALLVCQNAARRTSLLSATKSRVGRNEPCPCGSGKKYKKCCLDTDRAPFAGDNSSSLVRLQPQMLPRLWADDALVEDCALLGQIMERDEAFVNVGFSAEKVAAFMDTVCEQEPSPIASITDKDGEIGSRAIDDLAVRYIGQSGNWKVTRGMKDKFLAAARRVQSEAEARALATGICLALRAETTKDPADNLLGIILFRKALFAAAAPIRIMKKMFARLGTDPDELRRLIEANDPSLEEKIESAMADITPSELEALRAGLDRRHENLWDTIVAGEFPVPMPFATQLALAGQLASASNKGCSGEDLAEIMSAFRNELIEDDYVVYGQMLDRWLRDNKKPSDEIVDAVRMMRELCGIRSIKDLAPGLLSHCLRNRLALPFDAEEQSFINGPQSATETSEYIAKYGAWLGIKGRAGMANRLLRCWETWDTSPDELPLRKASVG
jgi:SEC-C motif